jgi:hypothetical protein
VLFGIAVQCPLGLERFKTGVEGKSRHGHLYLVQVRRQQVTEGQHCRRGQPATVDQPSRGAVGGHDGDVPHVHPGERPVTAVQPYVADGMWQWSQSWNPVRSGMKGSWRTFTVDVSSSAETPMQVVASPYYAPSNHDRNR